MTKEELKKQYNKNYYIKNKEKCLERSNKYFMDNKERLSKINSERHKYKYTNDIEYRNKIIKSSKERYERDREKNKLWHREYWAKMRKDVLLFVGNNVLRCVKCGFDDIRALQIDHVNGGGRKEVKQFKDNKKYLEHIKKTPENYQLLCANCNWIKKHENNEVR